MNGSTETAPSGAPILSIVIPTYNEMGNVEPLLEEVRAVLDQAGIPGEVIVVDDGSPDGTGEYVESVAAIDPRVRVVRRPGKSGLTSAVVAGFGIARGSWLGVMDADFSHAPSAIPALLTEARAGADFVIGSRYVEGGRIEGWPLSRRVVSRVACLLAWPFTDVRDPMSGFFLIHRDCLAGVELTAKGFKIVLDLLMKARYDRVSEVPIVFVDRRYGKSKISRREVFSLLRSLGDYARESLVQFVTGRHEIDPPAGHGGRAGRS